MARSLITLLFGYLGIHKSSSDRTLKTEDFYVVGTKYYEENIKKLATNVPEWHQSASSIISAGKDNHRIYRYNYVNRPVKLMPEPRNKHDKNAIQVLIAGELVGYISRDDNIHVKDILERHEIKYISSFISGGQYKIVIDSKNTEKGEKNLNINVRIAYV